MMMMMMMTFPFYVLTLETSEVTSPTSETAEPITVEMEVKTAPVETGNTIQPGRDHYLADVWF